MKEPKFSIFATVLASVAVCYGAAVVEAAPVAKTLETPGLSGWVPTGCRSGAVRASELPPRNAWRNLHGDARSSDEITRAIAPATEIVWDAESDTYNLTGPVFDDAGNLYFAPTLAFDDSVLISLNPDDGSRRWAIAG
ncbi:MAG: hypothetical protein ACI8TX_003807, partial [Hyphomicrobiaceae bacterium]